MVKIYGEFKRFEIPVIPRFQDSCQDSKMSEAINRIPNHLAPAEAHEYQTYIQNF